MTPTAHLIILLSSDWYEAPADYGGMSREQALDRHDAFAQETIRRFNEMAARNTGHTFRFATELPILPELLRPLVLLSNKTADELAIGPDGVSVLDELGQGMHFTTVMREINRLALSARAAFGDDAYFGNDTEFAAIDKWSADRELRNPHSRRVFVCVPKKGGGYAGGQSWYNNPPDADISLGQCGLGGWGNYYYVTGIPEPGCMIKYGIGLATADPTGSFGHEILHGMGVDSHFPVYLSLEDAQSTWAPEQVAAFLSFNREFLVPVSAPPPSPPPPPLTLVSVAVTGPVVLRVGDSADYNMTATYSDGSQVTVNELLHATYTTTNQNVLTIDQQGRATARGIGYASVAGRFTDGMGMDAPLLQVRVQKRRRWR